MVDFTRLFRSQNQTRNWLDQVVIRTVTRADLTALEWEGEYIHFRKMFAEAYQRAQRGGAVLWLAELPGIGVIGQLFVQLVNRQENQREIKAWGYIYGFRVRQQYRSRGLGTRMLEVAEADLLKRGYRRAALNVGRDNLAARKLYERLGYRITGADPGEWSYVDHLGQLHQVSEPAWRMEKSI